MEGESANTLGLDGTETFDIEGLRDDMEPNAELTVKATKEDGKEITFKVFTRLDTAIDVEYYQNGGILHTVIRDRLK
jgi:aconitate hydratase